jgi:hypothetical protein
MTASIQAKADLRAEALSAGRFDLLLPDYAFPLMLYLPDAPPCAIGPQQLEALYRAFHTGLAALRAGRIVARVTAEDLPRGSRSRLWVDWLAERPAGTPHLMARTICYRRQAGGQTRTEMVEFTFLDLPEQVTA